MENEKLLLDLNGGLKIDNEGGLAPHLSGRAAAIKEE
jgi:hypothetical protein